VEIFCAGRLFSKLLKGKIQGIQQLKVAPVNIILIHSVKKPLVMKGDGYAEKMDKFR
jgi:hypothetical protein